MIVSFIVVPSALIQASGLAPLTFNELRLFWRIVGMLAKEDEPPEDSSDQVTLRILAAHLMEVGEDNT